jgi:hypothetical protein
VIKPIVRSRYAFDTGGYIVLRQLLTPEEVHECNEAIDAMTHYADLVGSESYSGGSPLMRGRVNLFNRLADPIMALLPSTGTVAPSAATDAVHAAAEAVPQAGRGKIALEDLRAVLQRFELNGWKLNAEQIEALTETADNLSREGIWKPVAGKPHRLGEAADGLVSVGCSNWRIGGQLSWPQPHCEPFRELLCHPRLQPVLNTILGPGYRLDHGPCASCCVR